MLFSIKVYEGELFRIKTLIVTQLDRGNIIQLEGSESFNTALESRLMI